MKPNVVTLRTQQQMRNERPAARTQRRGEGAHVAVVDLAQRADLVRQRLDLRLLVLAHRLGRVDGGAGAGHLCVLSRGHGLKRLESSRLGGAM